MSRIRTSVLFLSVTAAGLTAGCGNQPGRVLLPQHSSDPAAMARQAATPGDVGPRLCFFNESFDYCYPSGGYTTDPSAEIPLDVEAGRAVTMNWSAEALPGRNVRAYRWSLDIEDVTDQTPRIDEETDLAHWSTPSPDTRSARLGPWTVGEQHRLFVEVEDDFGRRSLGIVRFSVVEATNQSPGCGSAVAAPAIVWPPDHRFVAVSIGGVTDPDGDPVTIQVTGVTQDEPVRGLDGVGHAAASSTPEGTPLEEDPTADSGGSRRCPDAVIRPDGTVLVRAERLPWDNGRVYVISFTASDPSGASCDGTVRVSVPHSRRRASVDDGQRFNSLDCRSPWPRRGPSRLSGS